MIPPKDAAAAGSSHRRIFLIERNWLRANSHNKIVFKRPFRIAKVQSFIVFVSHYQGLFERDSGQIVKQGGGLMDRSSAAGRSGLG